MASSEIIPSLISAHTSYNNNQENFFGLLEVVLSKKYWKKRFDPTYQEEIEFNSFREFVETKKMRGLGTTIPKLVALIEGYIQQSKDMSELDKNYYIDLSNKILNSAEEEVKLRGNHKGNQYTKKENGKVGISDFSKKKDNDTIVGRYRKLKRAADGGNIKAQEAKELFDKREITINKAFVMAGFQKKQFTCLMDIDSVASQIKSKFNRKDIKKIIELLGE